MKYAFLLCFLSLCCAPRARTPIVPAIDSETVALVALTDEGYRPVCAGVWVSATGFITAAHCVRDEEDNLVPSQTFLTEAGGDPMMATVEKVDEAHDLALLKTGPMVHGTAVLGAPAKQGDSIHIVGHTIGLYWSYTHGYVSAYRNMPGPEPTTGPWMQVSAPVWFGNSGGGAFDESGHLVGISSFIISKIPNAAFFVPVDTIRAFLGG